MEVVGKCRLFVVALALSGAAAFSAEEAVLRNGSAIRLDHRESRGEVTRLYLDAGTENYVDMRHEQIDRFEQLAESPAVPAPEPKQVRSVSLEEIVASAANRYDVDADLLLSLIHAESAFDLNAVSPKGALGLMQLMPRTAARFGVENPMDPAANVEGGTRYLSELLRLYDHNLTKALAAYNAGPSRIKQYHGVPPYPETVAYIARVERDLNQRKVAKSRLTSIPTDKDENKRKF
jgi:soluble lytic murein transglycosylase-like protein